jgi:hypothetical protein
VWGGYRPPAPQFRQPCFAHIVRSKKLINAPGDFHGDRQKKVHVVWNDPIKRDFFFTKGFQPLLLSKYGLPLVVLFSALILVFITFVVKAKKGG